MRFESLEFECKQPHRKTLDAYRACIAKERGLFWIGMDGEPRGESAAVDILDQLKQSPATAAELQSIAPSYKKRISELRKLDHNIKLNRNTKPPTYRLETG